MRNYLARDVRERDTERERERETTLLLRDMVEASQWTKASMGVTNGATSCMDPYVERVRPNHVRSRITYTECPPPNHGNTGDNVIESWKLPFQVPLLLSPCIETWTHLPEVIT
jgi:hypothetical protein